MNLVLVELGGGVRCTGLKASSSTTAVVPQEKGEYGSATIVSSGARDTDISGTCAGTKSMRNERERLIEVTK
jgi:hypothetical protein